MKHLIMRNTDQMFWNIYSTKNDIGSYKGTLLNHFNKHVPPNKKYFGANKALLMTRPT